MKRPATMRCRCHGDGTHLLHASAPQTLTLLFLYTTPGTCAAAARVHAYAGGDAYVFQGFGPGERDRICALLNGTATMSITPATAPQQQAALDSPARGGAPGGVRRISGGGAPSSGDSTPRR